MNKSSYQIICKFANNQVVRRAVNFWLPIHRVIKTALILTALTTRLTHQHPCQFLLEAQRPLLAGIWSITNTFHWISTVSIYPPHLPWLSHTCPSFPIRFHHLQSLVTSTYHFPACRFHPTRLHPPIHLSQLDPPIMSALAPPHHLFLLVIPPPLEPRCRVSTQNIDCPPLWPVGFLQQFGFAPIPGKLNNFFSLWLTTLSPSSAKFEFIQNSVAHNLPTPQSFPPSTRLKLVWENSSHAWMTTDPTAIGKCNAIQDKSVPWIRHHH